jgi:hypothetical protein
MPKDGTQAAEAAVGRWSKSLCFIWTIYEHMVNDSQKHGHESSKTWYTPCLLFCNTSLKYVKMQSPHGDTQQLKTHVSYKLIVNTYKTWSTIVNTHGTQSENTHKFHVHNVHEYA